ncbi:hypothetical protein BDV18DRAFT_142344 [Aspergillus unguis]
MIIHCIESPQLPSIKLAPRPNRPLTSKAHITRHQCRQTTQWTKARRAGYWADEGVAVQ